MGLNHLGPLYAIATAAAWAVSVVLFKRSGDSLDAVGLNAFKNVVGLALLGLTVAAVGGWPPVPLSHVLWLMASGAVGIGIADSLFFVSLNILGAARTAVVDCSYSPIIVVLSALILGERLEPFDGVGAVLIIGAMLLVIVRRDTAAAALDRRRWIIGVSCGLSAMLLMGIGIVAVKPVLGEYDVLYATTLRMIGGNVVLLVLFAVHGPARRRALTVFRPQRAWRWAIPGSIMGAYVSLLLWIAGFKHNDATVAAILNQTSTLFIVLLAAGFLGEPLTRRRTAAVLLGFGGSALVLL